MFKNRYERNLNSLSSKDMDILHSKKVCVIGCGGLGGYVIEMLSRIGICNITAVDFDVFDETNLNRQTFSTENFIGKEKVLACKDRIAQINSEVSINAVCSKIDSGNVNKIIEGHDVVVDALDSIGTRMLLGKCCAEVKIPLVHGSIAGWYGQVATILPGELTLDILYGSANDKGIESELGNLPFSAALVASLQCAEVIKLLTGKGAPISGAFMRLDLLNNDFTIIDFNENILES